MCMVAPGHGDTAGLPSLRVILVCFWLSQKTPVISNSVLKSCLFTNNLLYVNSRPLRRHWPLVRAAFCITAWWRVLHVEAEQALLVQVALPLIKPLMSSWGPALMTSCSPDYLPKAPPPLWCTSRVGHHKVATPRHGQSPLRGVSPESLAQPGRWTNSRCRGSQLGFGRPSTKPQIQPCVFPPVPFPLHLQH